ncbi:MAG: M56 family metallopeptidase [Gemmatimonadaceae bacterium]
MTPIMWDRVVTLLGDAALKSFVIFAVAGAINAASRKSSAASRHLIWTAAVCAAIGVPLIGVMLPQWKMPSVAVARPAALVESTPTLAINEEPIARVSTEQPEIDAAPIEQPSLERFSAPPPSPIVIAPRISFATAVAQFGIAKVIAIVWLAGLVLVLLPFCIGRLRLLALAASARPLTEGRWPDLLERIRSSATGRRVTLLESDQAAMPMTWGVISPVLLIPAGTNEWPEWSCRNILLHELAHVERFDCLTQFAARVACAVYWFNPLVWIAAHRMQVEREMACDDRVIDTGSRASEYAEQLLQVARSLRPARATAHAAIAMARRSQLSGRLTAVLDRERNRRSVSARFRMVVSVASFGVAVPVATFSPWVADAAASPVSAPRAAAHAIASVAAAIPIIKAVQSSEAPMGIIETTPAQPLSRQAVSCWESRDDHATSVNINDDDSHFGHTTVRFSSGDCTLELRADGKFTLRPDLSDVASLERGGSLTIDERDGRNSKRVEIRSSDSGLDRQYFVNGQRTAWSPEAQAWLANTLLAVERRTAFAAKTRVPQIFESRGARGVLDEVSLMPSDYAKAAYLSVLLNNGINLDGPTLTRIVQQSTREMKSDYYLAEVFTKVATQKYADESTWRAFADAAGGMKSDYYKAQVIGKVLSRPQLDAPTIATLLKATTTINSDYYQAETLKQLSKRNAVTPETRKYYLDALSKIKSDYYRQEVLSFLNTGEPIDASTTSAVLKSISDMTSDYYKSEALTKLIKQGRLDAQSRPDYFAAIRSMDSDYYKHAALDAALNTRPLTREMVAGVLSVAPSIKSDYELSGLLSSVARDYPIDDSLRPAYDKAIDSIESDYYRGAALSAARRSSTSR